MELSIRTSREGATERVSVAGEVDVSNADSLREALDGALGANAPGVVVDLAEVPYIDSTGIGVLVGAAHRAREAGSSLAVERPQRNVARVLGLLGVGDELGLGDASRPGGE